MPVALLVSVLRSDHCKIILKDGEGSFEGGEQVFRHPAVAAASPNRGNQLPLSRNDAPTCGDVILCERSARREIGHLASPLLCRRERKPSLSHRRPGRVVADDVQLYGKEAICSSLLVAI